MPAKKLEESTEMTALERLEARVAALWHEFVGRHGREPSMPPDAATQKKLGALSDAVDAMKEAGSWHDEVDTTKGRK